MVQWRPDRSQSMRANLVGYLQSYLRQTQRYPVKTMGSVLPSDIVRRPGHHFNSTSLIYCRLENAPQNSEQHRSFTRRTFCSRRFLRILSKEKTVCFASSAH